MGVDFYKCDMCDQVYHEDIVKTCFSLSISLCNECFSKYCSYFNDLKENYEGLRRLCICDLDKKSILKIKNNLIKKMKKKISDIVKDKDYCEDCRHTYDEENLDNS
jgi:hypothetical protein